MSRTNDNLIDPDSKTFEMKGSELHAPLKNRPGEQGDPDHVKDEGEKSEG